MVSAIESSDIKPVNQKNLPGNNIRLPKDLLFHLLKFLNAKDIAVASSVCKDWSKAIFAYPSKEQSDQLHTLIALRHLSKCSLISISSEKTEPYYSCMDIEDQLIAYSEGKYKLMIYNIVNGTKTEITRAKTTTFLKLHNQKLIINNSNGKLKIFDTQPEEETKEANEQLPVTEKRRSSILSNLDTNEFWPMNAYHKTTGVLAGFRSTRIVVIHPDKQPFEYIDITDVPTNQGLIYRALRLSNRQVSVAFTIYDSNKIIKQGYVQTYSLKTKKRICSKKFDEVPKEMMTNRTKIAVCFERTPIVVIDRKKGEILYELKREEKLKRDDALEKKEDSSTELIAMNNQWIISTVESEDRTIIQIWDAETGLLKTTYECKSKIILNSDNTALDRNNLIIGEGRYITIWDILSKEPLCKFDLKEQIFNKRFHRIIFKTDKESSYLLARDNKGDIYLWHPSTPKELHHDPLNAKDCISANGEL